MYGRATTCTYQFYCSSYPLLAQYAMAWKKWIACTPLSHNALLESHCFDATFASLPFHSVMQYGLETIQIVKERFESVLKFPQCLFKFLWFWVESVAHCWRLIVKIPLEFSVWYPIFKGAKLTRSTSAHALPLFLPRPESSRDRIGVLKRILSAPKVGHYAPKCPSTFLDRWRHCRYYMEKLSLTYVNGYV